MKFRFRCALVAALAGSETAEIVVRGSGWPLPRLHAPDFAPDVEATLGTGTKAVVGAVLGILPP